MKKTTIAIIIAILSVGALAGIYLFNREEPATTETPTISQPAANQPSSPQSESNAGSYTAAEVATHNSADDCWTIINDNVYDITAYIPRNPGGEEEIVAACGKDGTSLFTERKTESGQPVGSGTPHSSSAASQLESLKIGTVQD